MVKRVMRMLPLLCLFLSGTSFAGFLGPVHVPLPGPAGEGPRVGKEGRLIFSDPSKRLITIFTSSGEMVGSIAPPATIPETAFWPEDIAVAPLVDTVAAKGGGVVSILLPSGAVVATIDNPAGGELYAVADGFVVYDLGTDQYLRYSTLGEFRSRSSDIPTDLGVYLGAEAASPASFLHTVAYPDQTFRFSIPQEQLKSYRRDIRGNLYVTAGRTAGSTIYKVIGCGKVAAVLAIPEDVATFAGDAAVYGEPGFDSDGTVYVSRYGSTASVLKWTSVDEPVEGCQ